MAKKPVFSAPEGTLDKVIDALANRLDGIAIWADRQVPKMTAANAAEAYVALRLIDSKLAETIAAFSKAKHRLNEVTIPEAFEREGINTLTSKRTGYRVTVNELSRYSVRKGMKADAFKWLRKHRLGSLITETINSSTLAATGRSLLEEGKELDPDIFNLALMKSTSMVKVKPKPK